MIRRDGARCAYSGVFGDRASEAECLCVAMRKASSCSKILPLYEASTQCSDLVASILIKFLLFVICIAVIRIHPAQTTHGRCLAQQPMIATR